MTRIVSLIASATEIVYALGMDNQMVGRSHECDYPESVKELPVCTSPKFRTDGTSYQIDQRVKAILQESLSVYRVDAKKLDELKPTHIITQAQCEVCAVSLKDVEQAACQMISSQPQIVSLEPNSLQDVLHDIELVGKALGIPDEAGKLVSHLQEKMNNIANKAKTIESRPSVACIEWIEPLMAAGNWMPELVEMSGGRNLFGISGKHSPKMSWEELRQSNPDIIIVIPCGFDIPRTLSEMHVLQAKSGWKDLTAVKTGRVIVADGNQYFNRPGPRLSDSLEILAEIIHPKLFHFGHQGCGWLTIRPFMKATSHLAS